MEWLNSVLDSANGFLYTYILCTLLAGGGLYFTVATRFVQFRLLGDVMKNMAEKRTQAHSISSFQALMISTASRVGTGNIVGVSAAIAIGGPGSIFWMWIMALIGGASAFVESTLAQIYKRKDGEQFRGGPAYYIESAIGKRELGILYAILLMICTAVGWNSLTAFNISSTFEYYIPNYYEGMGPIVVGLMCAVFTAVAIFGGVRRIGDIAGVLVPAMSVFYIAMSLIAIVMNLSMMPKIFVMIFSDALDFQKIMGGVAGSCIVQGVKRGLFSNEAGMGTGPHAAATADVTHPVKQGVVQIFSVFLDTLFICSATGFLLFASGLEGSETLKGIPYVQAAAETLFGNFGIHFVTVSLFLFAYTTILGNYYFAESNLKFIKDDPKILTIFRCVQVIVVFLGAMMGFDLAWNLADFLMCLVTVMNLLAILWLGRIVINCLKDYDQQRKEGKDPVFKAASIGLTNTEFWK